MRGDYDLLKRLRIFVSVADRASFARGAEALSLTRPRVTIAIADLERELGARVFHRTTRRTTLTAEGELLYEHALQLLSDAERTTQLFGGSTDRPRGRLRVDIPVQLARSVIIPRLAEFKCSYPEVEIILSVSEQPIDLIANGVDCAIQFGELSGDALIARSIGEVDLIACGSPGYLAQAGTPKSIASLANHHAVLYSSERTRRPNAWQFMEDGVERSVRMRTALSVNDSEALIACAVAGIGLIQVPRVTVGEHLASTALVPVLTALSPITRQVFTLYPSREHLSPQVRAFADWSATLLDPV